MTIGAETAQAVVDLAASLRELGVEDLRTDPAPCLETLIVPTDATWQVSSDGHEWVQATPYSAFYRHAGIWDATPGGWYEALFFQTSFVVPGEARAVRAEGGSDDDLLSFSINGQRIFGENSGYSQELLRDDAISPSVLQAGANVVQAHARNIGGHSSFGAEIAIDFVPMPFLAAALETVREEGGRLSEGTAGRDALVGSGQSDLLSDGSGMDLLRGLSGDDFLLGGLGDDLLRGGLGDDVLDGGSGDDLIFAVRNNAPGGWGGSDTLIGGQGNDQLWGSAGGDLLSGGDGRDYLVGGRGDDTLEGGAGDDFVSGGAGDDTIRLGGGDDLVFHDASARHAFGRGDDRIWGEGGDDRLHGGRGDDAIYAGAGDDVVNGGAGFDLLRGGDGNDTFEFRSAYGIDRIEDLAPGDRLAFSRGINGLGEVTLNLLLQRITDNGAGARLDLGRANAVSFDGISAETLQQLLPMAFELI